MENDIVSISWWKMKTALGPLTIQTYLLATQVVKVILFVSRTKVSEKALFLLGHVWSNFLFGFWILGGLAPSSIFQSLVCRTSHKDSPQRTVTSFPAS